MAEPDLDRQYLTPNPGLVLASASHRRPGARVPALYAGRAGWMLRGACRSEDPELFSHLRGGSRGGAGQLSEGCLRPLPSAAGLPVLRPDNPAGWHLGRDD